MREIKKAGGQRLTTLKPKPQAEVKEDKGLSFRYREEYARVYYPNSYSGTAGRSRSM